MASSSRPSRTSPPRKPLHERSDSHANERTSPTLRIIGDPDARIYNSTPFPTLPAHILPPKSASRQGPLFEDEISVSDDDGLSHESEHDIPATAPLQIRKSKIIDAEREIDAERDDNEPNLPSLSTEIPSTEIPSTSSVAPTYLPGTRTGEPDVTNQDLSMAPGIRDERISDEIVQLPSVPGRNEALGSHRYTQDFTLVPAQTSILPKSSEASLSSAESTGTVIRTMPDPSPGSYSAFPNYYQSNSSKSNASSTASFKPTSEQSDDFSPSSSGSPISPILSAFSTPETRRTPSISATASFQPAQNGITIQYPIVRPPTASGSWAESTPSAPTRPPRNPNRVSDRWNPHLSVVHSDEMEDRNSGTMWLSESRDVSAANSSSYNSSSYNSRTGILAHPRPTYSRARDTTDSTIRVVHEDGDDLTALPEPIPGSRNSGYYMVQSGKSVREKRNPLQTRPSSRGSFLRDSIPAWARLYYGRPSTSSRPPTSASNSSENVGTGISRPRNRPHTSETQAENRDSMAIAPADSNVIDVPHRHKRKVSQVWSPHLWQDRRSFGRRRSLFKVPSVDEQTEELLTRRNVQIFLFALGFIFPFGWFAASFLPLPPKPDTKSKGPERRLSRQDLARDLEKALGHVDEARYENARWWRNLNRLMSILGVIVLAAIIALGVVAVRMKN